MEWRHLICMYLSLLLTLNWCGGDALSPRIFLLVQFLYQSAKIKIKIIKFINDIQGDYKENFADIRILCGLCVQQNK